MNFVGNGGRNLDEAAPKRVNERRAGALRGLGVALGGSVRALLSGICHRQPDA
jgi:hypothetical protein